MDFATVRDTAHVQAAINPMAAFWISVDTLFQALLRKMAGIREEITRMRESSQGPGGQPKAHH